MRASEISFVFLSMNYTLFIWYVMCDKDNKYERV